MIYYKNINLPVMETKCPFNPQKGYNTMQMLYNLMRDESSAFIAGIYIWLIHVEFRYNRFN